MDNNLIRESFWNSYFVITSNRGGGYELDNIIIYNENNILLETGQGWFNESNNNTGTVNIKNDILKVNTGTEDKHKKEKHNFIIKTKDSYKEGYTLYIYYKNVDYKPLKIVKEPLFIELKYQLFNNENITYSKVIGNSKKFSKKVYWELRTEIEKTNTDSYKYDNDIQSLKEHLKNINKLIKKYEKEKENEKSYSIECFIDGTSTDNFSNMEMYLINKDIIGGDENV